MTGRRGAGHGGTALGNRGLGAALASALAPALIVVCLSAPGPAGAQATFAPPSGSASAPADGLFLLSPRAARSSTTRELVHVLGRTAAAAQVQVAGEPVLVHATGVFARDGVPLALGPNRVLVEATLPDGRRIAQFLEIERGPVPPATGPAPLPADRLAIDAASLLPAVERRVAPGEAVEVGFRGTPGQRGQARLAGQPWVTLTEQSGQLGTGAQSAASGSRYSGHLSYPNGVDTDTDTEPAPVEFRLTAARGQRFKQAPGRSRVSSSSSGALGSARILNVSTTARVARWRNDIARLYAAGPEGAKLLHGVHEVRLGGPFLAELPTGTLLPVTGQVGAHYRIALASDTTAWAAIESLSPAPAGTPRPHAAFTSLSLQGNERGDVVTVSVVEHLPYAVSAVAHSDGAVQLALDLYGAHRAATWITHKASASLVREVSVQQPADGRVRVLIALKDRRLWGWRVERVGAALQITVRAAPPTAGAAASPLAGLLIALEPGHGGPSNLGAVGATGVPEKDINRWAVEALKAELEAAGAQVIVVREGDDNPSLADRADLVTASGAHLFISLHANATDTSRGTLRVSGTSSYYHHASGRDLAAALQRRLLAHTGLEDFGLIGAFNYAPIRLVTWMPAVLIEQAFMSHPGDEAAMLDPAFRRRMAQAVRFGVEDFLRQR